MEKLKTKLSYFNIAVLSTHTFCCVLPLIFSLTSIGVISLNMPILEEFVHSYEAEILILAGIILFITALVHYISYRIDCRKDGDCSHDSCTPKKKRSTIVFAIALVLFVINLVAFFSEGADTHSGHSHEEHGHHDNHNH